MGEESKPQGTRPAPNPLIKPAIELGPLVAFVVAWALAGIIWATGILMVASVVSLFASWRLLGHVSPVVIATAVLVLFFGGLTLWFDDPEFIKRKPTVVNLLFAGVLLIGLVTRRPLLKAILGEAFQLTEEGWRKLTVRWVCFFLALAALNEIVAQKYSTAVWVWFKFGILPLTVVFAMAQIGLIKRHELTPPDRTPEATS